MYEKNAYGPGQYHGRLVQRSLPVKLKGVDLPKFSGDDKADYEPWKAAFMSIVDGMDIPVGEKVLRLQSGLTGKALALGKDLGYSVNAYERAKEKLERRYGGERLAESSTPKFGRYGDLSRHTRESLDSTERLWSRTRTSRTQSESHSN